MPKKFYAVQYGRRGPQVYNTWAECQADVTGFSGAVFKSFGHLADAENFAAGGFTETAADEPGAELATHITTMKHLVVSLCEDLSNIQVDPYLSEFDTGKMPGGLTGGMVRMYTDGSCVNIGTPKAIAGSGIWYPDFNVGISTRVPGNQTNNRGELWAAIFGVQFIMAILRRRSPGFTGSMIRYPSFQINTDSTYTKNTLVNSGKLNLDLCGLLRQTAQVCHMEFKKVVGHSGDQGNDIADLLAGYFASTL